MIWPDNPVVHELFAWVWLAELSKRHGTAITLANVPSEVWDDIARPGIDAVWLMGVWQRSPVGAQIARAHPAMRAADLAALADLSDTDVVGSAYCIRDYVVDGRLGGEKGLAIARTELARRGVRLVLDLVPNHVAPDHRWAREHPEFFVQGTREDLVREPHAFIAVGDHVLACGRDPFFPAWPEVLQLDASHVGLRAAMLELVLGVAKRCDGLRCDMAMLVLDDVFVRTWGERARGGPRPDGGRGYWPPIIQVTQAAQPGFAFFAEAYWDLEPVLIDQGFSACYDKRLYDRMVHDGSTDVAGVRAHLSAPVGQQMHTLRFVENHDEPRAASLLTPAAHRAALTAVLTLPGVALLHEGQADGRRIRVPVTLARRPIEALDGELRCFLERLLAVVDGGMRRGVWSLAVVEGWPDNHSAERLLAWTWTSPRERHVVVVNLTGTRADGRVRLPWGELGGRTVILDDRLSSQRFERQGHELASDGLYVALDGFAVHVLKVS
jgi:hypothetical protein